MGQQSGLDPGPVNGGQGKKFPLGLPGGTNGNLPLLLPDRLSSDTPSSLSSLRFLVELAAQDLTMNFEKFRGLLKEVFLANWIVNQGNRFQALPERSLFALAVPTLLAHKSLQERQIVLGVGQNRQLGRDREKPGSTSS